MAAGVQITFDCADPNRLATFWAAALGYKIQDPPPGFETWEAFLEARNFPRERWGDFSAIVDPDRAGPRMCFQRVPEPKERKNRVHLDVNVGGPMGTPADQRRPRVDAAVQRLVEAGATVLETREGHFGERWVVMQDPEGNEFCVQ